MLTPNFFNERIHFNMKEMKENSPKGISRKNFLLTAAMSLAGVGGRVVLGRELTSGEAQSETQQDEPIIEAIVPVGVLPLIIKSGAYQIDGLPAYDGILDSEQLPFLTGSALIGSLLIEKSLKHTLTVDEINKVTEAIMALRGIDRLPNDREFPHPNDRFKALSPIEKLIAVLEITLDNKA